MGFAGRRQTAGPFGYPPNVQDYLKRRYLTLGRIAEIDEGAKAIWRPSPMPATTSRRSTSS